MWCVIYAGDGKEEETEEFVRKVLPVSNYSRCFHLVQHMAHKRQGILWEVTRNCFPGYVFVETEKPDAVQKILEHTQKRLLFSDDRYVSALDGKEEALLRLITDQDGNIGLSLVRTSVDDDSGRRKAEFLSGPLTKVADKVAYIDFHNRRAKLNFGVVGGKESLKLGFAYDDDKFYSGI